MNTVHPSPNMTDLDVPPSIESHDWSNDPILFKLYQTGMRRRIRNDLLLPLSITAYFSATTRFNLQSTGTNNVYFKLSFAFLVLVTVLFVPYVVTQLVVHHTPSNKMASSYCYKRSYSFQQAAIRLHLQDIICISSLLINGFVLIGRVHAGQCGHAVDIWTNQTCNPFSDVGAIPFDQVTLLSSIPNTLVQSLWAELRNFSDPKAYSVLLNSTNPTTKPFFCSCPYLLRIQQSPYLLIVSL